MNKYIRVIIKFTVYIGLLLAVFSTTADYEAAEKKDGPTGGFAYEVIHPKNQHSEVSYFDLRMTPGEKQTVQIKLTNSSDKEIQVSVKLSGAKTNSNGVIEYGPTEIKNDASLKYDFTDLVKAPELVKIPAKGEELVNFDITMPEASFDGDISGGIQLQEEGNEQSSKKEGMVVNKFAYLVGMLLSETDKELKPELTLNKVYPELKNYRNAIFVNFSNTQPVYVEGMTTEVQIMKADTDKVLYDTKKAKMRMAPNTLINFPVSMNGEKMIPGKYRAKILVTADDGGKWAWEEQFSITDEEANKFNEQDVSLTQEANMNWKLIVMIVSGALGVILVIFLVVHFINKNKQSKKRKGKRNTKGKNK